MILVLTDADGRTVAKADITGSRWKVSPEGFVNRDEIRLDVVTAGVFPEEGWIEYHDGTRVSHIELDLDHQDHSSWGVMGWLEYEMVYRPIIRAGKLPLKLLPLRPPETKS